MGIYPYKREGVLKRGYKLPQGLIISINPAFCGDQRKNLFLYNLYSHLQLGHWLSSSIDWTMANRSCMGLWESVRHYCSQLVLIGLSVQQRSQL
uniref:Uncharacterized protein n=1 Tax=Picea glauca TaxID=3330 RepID=A0A124GNC8_PICGL|nr:hypothetical protein ABT39_MTgene5393 [Picea glauca]QHR91094.1 hypothetical protein Q903MT_gene5126 [Picea sitchensis]